LEQVFVDFAIASLTPFQIHTFAAMLCAYQPKICNRATVFLALIVGRHGLFLRINKCLSILSRYGRAANILCSHLARLA
jgi:hypothetical protein